MFLSNSTSPSAPDAQMYKTLTFKNVTKSLLADFKFEHRLVSFEPSMEKIEFSLKECIHAPVTRLQQLKKCQSDFFKKPAVTGCHNNFIENKSEIESTEKIFDEILVNGFLPIISFLFVILNFEFLMYDANSILQPEIEGLEKNKNIVELVKEMKAMDRDREF
jgi:hypothetical protein